MSWPRRRKWKDFSRYQYGKLMLTYFAKSDTAIVVLAKNVQKINDISPKLQFENWFWRFIFTVDMVMRQEPKLTYV